MLKLHLDNLSSSDYKILCLGAHSDDIEIGCGGTILKLIENYPNLGFYWVVFSATPHREQEAIASANLFLNNIKAKNVVIKNFRDGFFPYIGQEIKEYFEQLKQQFSPDIIFTHYRQDLHQDHRLISDLTWNTFRDHLILEYEISKYDGDLGHPNFFVHLNDDLCRQKIQYLFDAFPTQHNNHWFTEETFLSMLRLRGVESNAPHKYAEAFHCRKMVGLF